jgi:hypothetical protein
MNVHILPRFRRAQLEREEQMKVDRAVNESVGNPSTVIRATLPGDIRRLRGIPAIGRGVDGAIPGTRPGQQR